MAVDPLGLKAPLVHSCVQKGVISHILIYIPSQSIRPDPSPPPITWEWASQVEYKGESIRNLEMERVHLLNPFTVVTVVLFLLWMPTYFIYLFIYV